MAKLFSTGFIFSVLLLWAVIPVLAQEPDYDRINKIAAQMNCPTCVGVSLADCQTQTCAQWRNQISDLVEEGYSDQEVLDFFANRYGTQVLLAPPKSGSTLVLWLLPVIAVVAGGGWLTFYLRRKQTYKPAITTSAPFAADDEYLTQVDKDLGLENK
jgi:cytochrome c-type biogenesis protein CcmH